jgi:hypothetical protein
MWESQDPFDAYAIVHLASVAGDALVALALADSIFFSLPVERARLRVALYLGLTLAPLAIAGPLLVPLLDRGRFRRAVSFLAAGGRAVAVLFAAPRVDTLLLFPATFIVLVLSRVHTIAKNGLVAAYAGDRSLMASNARLGRVAAVGVLVAVAPGAVLLVLAEATAVLYVAATVYCVAALLNLQLERHEVPPSPAAQSVPRGRVVEMATAAGGTAGLRAAQGFLILLLALALRDEGRPTYWLGVLGLAIVLGAFLGDLIAPRLPRTLREEAVVLGALLAAGAAALVAFTAFALPTLAAFAALSGMATESGRLAFASLMQRMAPAGAHGRVFVRYEVLFQLAWVAGAFVPAMVEIPFRTGLIALAGFEILFGLAFLAGPRLRRPGP